MKIQEMKSGVSHLIKKAEPVARDNILEMRALTDPEPEALVEDGPCELEEPRWSVVSFDRRVGGHLTYDQAAVLMAELDAKKIPGLCIVADEAAVRIKS